jgi:hypothetical protein
MFEEGYIAISYAWGRWRVGWQEVPGALWPVPSIRSTNHDFPGVVCKFSITELLRILRRMPGRRFVWIDVLCIPQNVESLKKEKAEEIAKQGAIFKNATAVLVYLWSLDTGTQLASAINELNNMMGWYWGLNGPKNLEADRKHNGRKACVDNFGPMLRNDPWFNAMWTLQEMVLAPASIWIARDGSHCRVHDQTILTTDVIANKFHDFPVLGAYHSALGSQSFDPSLHLVEANIPESESQSRKIMLAWLHWAFKNTLITTSTVESRSGILQATSKRFYDGRRDLPSLAALKIGNDKNYDKDMNLVDDIPVSAWNDAIAAEGGRLFDCDHTSRGPLTGILPTKADSVTLFRGIREVCDGWEVLKSKATKIARGSKMNYLSPTGATEYRFGGKTTVGGDPVENVKKYLSGKNIKVKHVRFIPIGYELPKDLFNGGKFARVRGMILVTKSENIRGSTCRWYKTGTYVSKDYENERLEHDIIVSE